MTQETQANSNLAAAIGAEASSQVVERKPQSLAQVLSGEGFKKQMAMALPKHMTAERMTRIALTEIRKTPALAKCNQASFLGALMQSAQLGLEPGGAMGHAYLLPFGNGKASDGLSNCQLIIGYRGMIDLARRSGQIISISARVVHEFDLFEYQFGLSEDLKHVPATGERGKPTHVYAVARLKDGGIQFEVMSRIEIEAVRAQSKASGSGPWVTHWDEMAKKTVIRRLFKYLPVSIEMAKAISLDEKADAGIDQGNADALEGEFEQID